MKKKKQKTKKQSHTRNLLQSRFLQIRVKIKQTYLVFHFQDANICKSLKYYSNRSHIKVYFSLWKYHEVKIILLFSRK